MDTRKDYEARYRTRDGRIVDPGKFEGEPLYVVYFWDVFLEFGADTDEEDDEVLMFEVTDEDREILGDLLPPDVKTVRLYERSDGFVCEV